MADLPAVSDLLSASFATADWCDLDKVNRDEDGNLIGSLPESQSANRPTAEFGNGVSAALRQASTFFRGTAETDALHIATTLRIPRFTTAGRPAAGTSGRMIYDTDLDALFMDDGAAWDPVGATDIGDISDDVLYDQDFSTLANNTFADGSEVIGSHTWTAANVAAATIFDIQNGTGLRFDATTTSTVYNTSTRSASNIGIPITTLIPAFDPLRTYVIDVYFTTLTLGNVANRVLVCFDNNGAGTDHLSGGGPHNDFIGTQIESTTSAATPRGAHNVIGVRISPEGVAAYASTYASGFPVYALAGSYQPHATQNFSPAMDPTNTRLVIAFVTGEAGGAMVATLRRLRVRRIN